MRRQLTKEQAALFQKALTAINEYERKHAFRLDGSGARYFVQSIKFLCQNFKFRQMNYTYKDEKGEMQDIVAHGTSVKREEDIPQYLSQLTKCLKFIFEDNRVPLQYILPFMAKAGCIDDQYNRLYIIKHQLLEGNLRLEDKALLARSLYYREGMSGTTFIDLIQKDKFLACTSEDLPRLKQIFLAGGLFEEKAFPELRLPEVREFKGISLVNHEKEVVKQFFLVYDKKRGESGGIRSFWKNKDRDQISLKDILNHAQGNNNRGLFGYSGKETKEILIRVFSFTAEDLKSEASAKRKMESMILESGPSSAPSSKK